MRFASPLIKIGVGNFSNRLSLPGFKGITGVLCSIFFLFSFFSSTSVYSQVGKEANNWFFGVNAGLDFNSGSPVAVTTGAMNISEGCSSISDQNGGLLFYTDGRNVWNRSHVVMGNGTGLSAGNGGSSTQGALIVPRPGSNTLYYIFTTDEQGGGAGLRYSVVDMSLNATMGDVTVKNVLLYSPTTEKLTAVKHCNGKDIWLISHEDLSNTFKNYLITSTGIQPVVNSSVGTALTVGAAEIGQMKVSPTGAKIALACYTSSNVLELFDFNNVNGTVSNPISIANNAWGYGVEFSPNGRLLYVTDVQNKRINQYDVCAGSSAAFAASKVQVGTSANSLLSLQLGPDRKIYAARWANPLVAWVGVINSPNTVGVGCGYVDNGVALSTGRSQQGLPGFVQSFFRDTFPTFTYASNCLALTFTPPPSNCANPINAVAWNFGDPSSGTANASTLMNPSHAYALPGNYTVRLIVNCVDTLYKTIPVNVCPLTVTSSNSAVCPGICASVSALASAGAPGYSYSWSPNIGIGAGPYNVCPVVTTVYTVTVTDAAGGTAVSSSTVTVHPATTPNISKTDITCNGSANGIAGVSPSGGTPGYRYSWTGGSTNAAISNLSPGTYTVTITDANSCTVRTTTVIAQPTALTTGTTVVNVNCNGGTNGSITATPAGGTTPYTYSWSNTRTTQTITGLNAAVYSVTVTDANGCKSNVSATVTQPATPVTGTLTPTHVTCNGGTNGVVSATGAGGTPGYTYSWSTLR